MTKVVDLWNLALSRIKYQGAPVGSPYEGSMAARVGLQIYSQTRDSLFASADWDFLTKEVALGAPTKTAPAGGYGSTPWNPTTNPQIPWWFQYDYPTSCIQIRSLRPTPILLPEFAPMYTRFVVASDAVTSDKVVLTNAYSPIAVFTAQVNDPAEWQDAIFTEALIDALAVQFEKRFGQDLNSVQLAERDAVQTAMLADQRMG